MTTKGLFGYLVASVCLLLLISACGKKTEHAQAKLRNEHAPKIEKMLQMDVAQHLAGVKAVAERVVELYALAPEARAAAIEQKLNRIRKPPTGVRELYSSPLTFVAALDENGIVIARNGKKRGMVGLNLAKGHVVLEKVLQGGPADQAIIEFKSEDESADKSVMWVFAAPVMRESKVVGAAVIGFPLWRLDQRINNQMRVDYGKRGKGGKEENLILWAYISYGSELHHFATPPDLTQVVPKASDRAQKLKQQPEGYTGEVVQYGRAYAYGVFPLAKFDPQLGLILFRSDP